MKRAKTFKTMTNVEFVTNIMEYSKHGPLAQAFIIEAISKWSELVSKADPAKLDTPFMSGAAWVGVAKEIYTKTEERFDRS